MSLNERISAWRGRRVWLIGASSGIGAALARALLQAGARVALSARKREALDQLAGDSSAALVLPLDVNATSAVEHALNTIVAAWHGIDLVVMLAGTHEPMRAWDFDGIAADRLLETNLNAVVRALPCIVRQLDRQKGGGLALVSSVAGYRGLPTALAYGASKAALINLAETLYLDLRPRGISVYLINPGFVKTPLTDRNEFRMPALIEADEAARHILQGFARGQFEMHFPRRFTAWLKLFRLLPYRWYFALIHRLTGL